jgi:hypothetical protein
MVDGHTSPPWQVHSRFGGFGGRPGPGIWILAAAAMLSASHAETVKACEAVSHAKTACSPAFRRRARPVVETVILHLPIDEYLPSQHHLIHKTEPG